MNIKWIRQQPFIFNHTAHSLANFQIAFLKLNLDCFLELFKTNIVDFSNAWNFDSQPSLPFLESFDLIQNFPFYTFWKHPSYTHFFHVHHFLQCCPSAKCVIVISWNDAFKFGHLRFQMSSEMKYHPKCESIIKMSFSSKTFGLLRLKKRRS